jgi:hypothetical protein
MIKKARNTKARKQPDRIPGFSRGQLAEVFALIDGRDLSDGPPTLPANVNKAVFQMVTDTAQLIPHMSELNPLSERGVEWILGMLHYCAAQGFSMALYRYADELQAVPELSAWNRKRAAGGERGRNTQQKKKLDRLPEIKAMISEGKSIKQIAVALEVDPSTIYRTLTPGKQRRKR